jgi:putative DNA primase/helicase
MVEETDLGTWRRLCLVKFPYTFRGTPEEVFTPADILGDPNLRARCESDPDVWAAALTWMVDGARKWYEADRVMPEDPVRVEVDTWDWRQESDQVLGHIDERLKMGRDAADRHIPAQDLLDDVNDWLTARNHKPWSDKTLASRFGDHDVVTGNRIVKRKVRRSDKVSRPNEEPPHVRGSYSFYEDPVRREPLPETYAAWVGVRFATDADRAAD